jgi:hypothetical protein
VPNQNHKSKLPKQNMPQTVKPNVSANCQTECAQSKLVTKCVKSKQLKTKCQIKTAKPSVPKQKTTKPQCKKKH